MQMSIACLSLKSLENASIIILIVLILFIEHVFVYLLVVIKNICYHHSLNINSAHYVTDQKNDANYLEAYNTDNLFHIECIDMFKNVTNLIQTKNSSKSAKSQSF